MTLLQHDWSILGFDTLLKTTMDLQVAEKHRYNFLKWVSFSCTGIDGASYNPPKWIPSPIIKPVMEFVKTLFCQEASGPVIEIPVIKQTENSVNQVLGSCQNNNLKAVLTDQTHGWRSQTATRKTIWWRTLEENDKTDRIRGQLT